MGLTGARPSRRPAAMTFARSSLALGKEMNGVKNRWPASYVDLPDDARVPVYPKNDVHIVVVGGEANAMMQGWNMYGATTTSIDKWR
jgi:hypothetical protein